jgi:hypothetical protein
MAAGARPLIRAPRIHRPRISEAGPGDAEESGLVVVLRPRAQRPVSTSTLCRGRCSGGPHAGGCRHLFSGRSG